MASKKKKAPTKAQIKKAALKDLQSRYAHVAKITEMGKHERATRVEIECQADYDLESCKGTREIAVQDAFQVKRCTACQREYTRRRRRKTPVEDAA